VPIFEYRCGRCGLEFEKLVTGCGIPACPSCGGKRVEKRFSVFGARIGGKFTPSKGGGCSSCAKASCSSCR